MVDPTTPAPLDGSAVVPMVAADVQPSDEAIWTAPDPDGGERQYAEQVEYLVMPPGRQEVVFVTQDGERFSLPRDHPVVAVRGEDWRWWLSSER